MKLDKNHPQDNALDGTIFHHNLVADQGAYVNIGGRNGQPMMIAFDIKDLKELADIYRELELRSVLEHLPVTRWGDRPMTDKELKASHRVITRALNGIRSACTNWICTAYTPWAEAGERQLASDCLQRVEYQLRQVFPDANDRDLSRD
ncbi:hypothetical protein EU244_033775 [Rhodococcus qingshengii]|uniref:hypothetical protein n=1 Tax=Rhodococcus qingshengii TaxID=334542 RepID=UPI0010A60ED2|nr:hypothetical protein [Rhodococcus qingshengii]THJ69500.1 hypothetical protein EU244_21310 [Rhodococcus qingshengii]